VNPEFGVKNHLKSVLEHFFYYWNTDREVLKKVGRPPKELAIPSGVSTVDPATDNNNNNNNNNNAEPPAKFGKFSNCCLISYCFVCFC
jgi:hypothetical protein